MGSHIDPYITSLQVFTDLASTKLTMYMINPSGQRFHLPHSRNMSFQSPVFLIAVHIILDPVAQRVDHLDLITNKSLVYFATRLFLIHQSCKCIRMFHSIRPHLLNSVLFLLCTAGRYLGRYIMRIHREAELQSGYLRQVIAIIIANERC